MQQVTIICSFCGKLSEKAAKRIRWAKSKGQNRFYCDLDCMQRGLALGRVQQGTALRNLFCRYKQTAKRRKVSFDLTILEFRILVERSCHYCGDAPAQVARAKSGETLKYNGVDRVNNSLGYSVENSVSCCGVCNRWKSSMSRDEFLKHIEKIFRRTTMVTNLSKTVHTV